MTQEESLSLSVPNIPSLLVCNNLQDLDTIACPDDVLGNHTRFRPCRLTFPPR